MNKSLVVALVAVVVIAIGGYSFPKVLQYGSITGPDSPYEYESVNGVTMYYYNSGLNQASTTICSFKTPPATTTVSFGSVAVTTGTTTAIALEIGSAAVMDATTTRLAYKTLASGELVTLPTFVATTTALVNGAYLFPADPTAMVIGPSRYINVKYGAALGSLNVLVGSCKFKLVVN